MLSNLSLEHIGPAARMDAHFGSRLNLFTGDNGLGKTFLLDWAWRVLTGTWVENREIIPLRTDNGTPSVCSSIRGMNGKNDSINFNYNFKEQSWTHTITPPSHSGLVIYARMNQGFSVWDPTKRITYENFNLPQGLRVMAAGTSTHHFSRHQVLNGFPPDEKTGEISCRGLIADWVKWQDRTGKGEERDPFKVLEAVLETLSPGEDERMKPGKPTRVSIKDSRDIPTLLLPYEQVPVTQTSAAIRRILGLAYMLVWAWDEHLTSCDVLGIEPTDKLILLVDEVEAHLHPRWQRAILPSLLTVANLLRLDMSVQILATSHAPLVLASVEPHFDENSDKLFVFRTMNRRVDLTEIPWAKQGDVVAWLESDSFNETSPRSREAERAIKAAEAFMRGDSKKNKAYGLETREAIHKELLKVLPGHDPFWPRWIIETKSSEA
jgi:hypothetical protein